MKSELISGAHASDGVVWFHKLCESIHTILSTNLSTTYGGDSRVMPVPILMDSASAIQLANHLNSTQFSRRSHRNTRVSDQRRMRVRLHSANILLSILQPLRLPHQALSTSSQSSLSATAINTRRRATPLSLANLQTKTTHQTKVSKLHYTFTHRHLPDAFFQ